MKYLVVALVVALVGWLVLGRQRGRGRQQPQARPPGGAASNATPDAVRRSAPNAATATGAKLMVNCAHCGLHLPDPEALVGAQGLRFCSEAHRVAGPH